MNIVGINHIGLAPKDPEKARWFLKQILGLSHLADELVESQATNTAIYQSQTNQTQSRLPLLEILENQSGKDGPIKTYIDRKGGGIHHLALTVTNVVQAVQELSDKGIELVHKTPQPGVCQTQIVFVHPRSTGGLLIELVEEPAPSVAT